MDAPDLHVGLLIIGGGPAGSALLFEAKRQGALDDLLNLGVCLVDPHRDTIGAGALGRYHVRSDTVGRVFVECANDVVAGMTMTDTMQDLFATCDVDRPVPLHIAARLLSEAGDEMLRETSDRAGHDIHLAGRVERLVVGAGVPRARVRTATGVCHVSADRVVIAIGGQPFIPDWLRRDLIAPVRHADWILRNPASLAGPLGSAAPQIAVVGASHSAFSAASVLLRSDPERRWRPGSVTILHRSTIRVSFPSVAAAQAESVPVTPADVCQATGRVYRFGGLRGDSADLWRRIRDGSEARVRLLAIPDGEDGARAFLGTSNLVVAATGYASAARKLLHRPTLDDRLSPFDSSGQLIDDGGIVVPHVFGLGLGTGRRRDETTGGEPSFTGAIDGAWFYRRILASALLPTLLSDPGAARHKASTY